MSAPENIDSYIANYPEDIQERLQAVRKAILEVIPDGEEVISYGIPAIKKGKKVGIYFAAYKAHTGLAFYPTELVYEVLKEELAPYKKSKSTVQFPYNKPLPLELIKKIARLKLEEA